MRRQLERPRHRAADGNGLTRHRKNTSSAELCHKHNTD
jgi:hypothetical protein